MPYAIDLFCGAGGCSEGLLQAGFHILFSSDISEMVEVTYKNRHRQLGLIQGENTWFERADIKNLTGDYIRERISSLSMFKDKAMPEIDVIFGGPSCQGFSRAGRSFEGKSIVVTDKMPAIEQLGFLGIPFFQKTVVFDFSGGVMMVQ